MPSCLKTFSVSKGILEMFKRSFQYGFRWNQVKYAKITTTHVSFMALTLAVSFMALTLPRSLGL